MESWYPAWKVRLVVRLEEFDSKANDALLPSKKKLPSQLKGKVTQRKDALPVTLDPSAPPGVTRYILGTAVDSGADPSANSLDGFDANGDPIDTPQTPSASADGLTSPPIVVIPRKFTWRANGIREADQCTIEVKFLDLPFHPLCIRSCAVEFFLGTVTADAFAEGVTGKVRSTGSGGELEGQPLSVVPDSFVDANGTQRSNMRFQGWVDDWGVEFGEDGEPFVKLECRDNTSLLIDNEAPAQLAIDEKLEIDKAIATYLSNFPQYAGLAVEYRPAGGDKPTLGSAMGKTAFKPTIGPAPSKGGAPGGSKLSVWDYLTDVCGAVGHLVRVEDSSIIVQRARDITAGTSGRPDDPFTARNVDGLEVPRRAFVYGRNVVSMKYARKYGKGVPTNIEVRCYSSLRKKTLVARFPLKQDAQVNPLLPGDGKGEQKVLVMRVSGIEDEKTLRLIAQSYYEVIGRNEMTVHIKTKNLASFGGDNEDPDLLDIKAGDSIDVLVNRDLTNDSDMGALNNVERAMLVQQSALAFLKAAGYEGAFAEAYAKAFESLGMQYTYMVRAFVVEGATDDGVSFDVDGVNYVTVRAEKVLPEGEEQTP
jgi:hypothetical protein